MEKKDITTYAILGGFIIIIIITIFFLRSNGSIDRETTECIGQKSELYVQLGCHACETQEKMFGENYKYLNIVDCADESEKCAQAQIRATPTWIINDQSHVGVQSLEQLKQLTGC
tara:strand:- start:41 stop:385 length:345 start_codon:yes stop_codon:yes gene_type:complete